MKQKTLLLILLTAVCVNYALVFWGYDTYVLSLYLDKSALVFIASATMVLTVAFMYGAYKDDVFGDYYVSNVITFVVPFLQGMVLSAIIIGVHVSFLQWLFGYGTLSAAVNIFVGYKATNARDEKAEDAEVQGFG